MRVPTIAPRRKLRFSHRSPDVSRRKVLPIGHTACRNFHIRCGDRGVRRDLHTQQRRVPARVDQFGPHDAWHTVNVGHGQIEHSTAPVAKREGAGYGRALLCLGAL